MKQEGSRRKLGNCVVCICLMLRNLLFHNWKNVAISSRYKKTRCMSLTVHAVENWLCFVPVRNGCSLSPKITPLPSYSTPKNIGIITATRIIKIFAMYKTLSSISEICRFQHSANGECRFQSSFATSVMNLLLIKIPSMQSGILYNEGLNSGSD